MTALQATAPKQSSFGDSFVHGVLLMLVINVGQRVVGLLRNLGFCQFLSDADLGLWALANSFFVISAPFAVLGLPGSFGKFVEHYRQRGSLRTYLTRVVYICVGSTLILAALMICFRDRFSWMIYGESFSFSVIAWTAITMVAQVGYNIAFDVTISLRQVRVTSRMQFATGTSFAILGIACLSVGGHWTVLLPCYAIACLLGMGVGLWSVWKNCSEQFVACEPLTQRALWPRILPFAVALWAANLLANSFELSDRYMLLHFSNGSESVGQALVGQYYCGRIIPNLMTSIALMLGGVLLPYLSADWEAGRPQHIQRRMQQVLSMVSLLFTAIAIGALLISPVLFKFVFEDRYRGAESILGLSLVQCIWASVHIIGSSYLFCAERANRHSINLVLGLFVSVGLNWFLIYHYGLIGAVTSTLIANLAVMFLTFRSMHQFGCPIERRTILFAVLPAVLLLGPTISAIVVVGLFFIASRTEWLLSKEDRQDIDALILPKLKKLGYKFDSLWPT
jgi:polysaccharide transporter, PST family